MHVALRIDDVLSQIFGHIRDSLCVDNEENSEDRRRDLATAYHAALVCKTFLPHALDALWFWMEELEPLFALLPETTKYQTREGLSFKSDSPLRKNDLKVFDRYARRIKACYYYEENFVRQNSMTMMPLVKQVLKCLKRPCLLPNLRHIWVEELERPADPRNPVQSFCFLLFGASLRIFEISLAGKGELLYLLPHLSKTAPSLSHLDLFETKMVPRLLNLLQFPNLRYLSTAGHIVLSLDSFSSTFPYAPTLENWTVDSLRIRGEDRGRGQLSAGRPLFHFPSLKELTLSEQPDVSTLRDLFTFISFSKLRRLEFTIKKVHDDGSFVQRCKDLFTVLFRQRNCLEAFVAGWSDSDQKNPPGFRLDELLADTVPDQALLELDISYFLTFDSICGSSLRRLAQTFPHLQALYVCTSNTAIISFNNLALLAQLLPDLLHLSLGGLRAESLPSRPTVPVLSHGLKALCLSGSRIGNPYIFARYLDRLFPYVAIGADCGCEPTPLEQRVISTLNLMKGCREDEVVRNGGNM